MLIYKNLFIILLNRLLFSTGYCYSPIKVTSFSILLKSEYISLTSSEPEAKKVAALVADPLIGLRGGPPTGTSISDAAAQAAVAARVAVQSTSPPAVMAGMGGICNEDIRVPDKMVGLSKYKYYPHFPLSKQNFRIKLCSLSHSSKKFPIE